MPETTKGMISVDEAMTNVLAGVSRLSAEVVSVAEAIGRVLAEDVASRITQPPVAVSSMDGYAVRAEDVADVPVTLTQIGESAAGDGFDGVVGPGQTSRIFTGAPLPKGVDAVVIQEDTDADGDQITMKENPIAGRYIRPAGLDFTEGDVLLKTGALLNSRDIALAAAMNVPWLKVIRRPKVAILATGNELVMPGEPVGPNQIISSNSLGIAALVRARGGIPVNLGIAEDDAETLKNMLAGVKGTDMLVTIGGASVGDYDLIKDVLGEEGLDITFGRVAMRPGKPLIFGNIYNTPMLGLPGNPVSAGVTAALFLTAAMDVMLGAENLENRKETAILTSDLKENDQRQDYLRSELGIGEAGELTVTPFTGQDSSMLALFARAQCLVIRPPFAEQAKAGDRVEILRLDKG